MIVIGLIAEFTIKPTRMSDYRWSEPTWENVTDILPLPFCSLKMLDWSIVELAGAPLLLDMFPEDSFWTYQREDQPENCYSVSTSGWDIDFILDEEADPWKGNASEALWRLIRDRRDSPILEPDFGDETYDETVLEVDFH